MIVVFSPLLVNRIKDTLHQQDGIFTHVKSKGIAHYFETTIEDKRQAASVAESLIRQQSWAGILNINVSGIDENGEIIWAVLK